MGIGGGMQCGVDMLRINLFEVVGMFECKYVMVVMIDGIEMVLIIFNIFDVLFGISVVDVCLKIYFFGFGDQFDLGKFQLIINQLFEYGFY